MLLHELVLSACRKWPERIAMIEEGRSLTYRELDEKVKALASEILRKGLKKKERVGILSRNSIESTAVYFAVSRAGGVSVLLNYTLNPLDITYQTKDASVSALYIGRGLERKAKDVLKRAKTVRFIVEGPQASSSIKKFPKVNENDLVSIIYTSGTTRRQLGVMLSHKNLISNNRSIVRYARLRGSDRICCVLPFYYIYGLSLILSHFLVGGTVIIENRFMYPNVVLDTIEKERATGFAGVSSHYAILLYKSDFKSRRLPSLKYFMQAGDAMPEALTKRLTDAFPDKKLYIMYGQSEASPRLAFLRPELVKLKPASIGKAIPGVKIRVVNEKGEECRPHEEGEIIARGDNIMLGYWNNKKETKKVIRHGWLWTGDVAYKDEDGDLFIVGRKKQFLKLGGHRVNPLEIERLAMEYKGVMEAAVVATPDPILGKRLRLFVSPMSGEIIDKDDILRFCKKTLPSYKLPKEVIILKSIPRNSFGKIDKGALKSI